MVILMEKYDVISATNYLILGFLDHSPQLNAMYEILDQTLSDVVLLLLSNDR